MQTTLVKHFIDEHSGNDSKFPRVVSVTDTPGEFQLQLEVTADLDGFQGHFPGNPVLPGIVQLHWAVRFSRQLFNYQGIPMEIKRLKFKNIVQPPATLTLVLRQTSESQIEFEFVSAQYSHSSGAMVYEQNPA